MSEQAGKEGGGVSVTSVRYREEEETEKKGGKGGRVVASPPFQNGADEIAHRSLQHNLEADQERGGWEEEERGMRQSCHQPLTPADGSTSIMMVVMLYFTACSTKTGTALAALPDSNAGGGIGTQTPLSNPASMSGLQNAIPSYI